jgi:hypothetical protein
MLNDEQKAALRKWYLRPEVMNEARRLIASESWEELEELIHMHTLMPLRRPSELPDYLKNEKGKALIPSNCSPMNSVEDWQDAIEVGWSVVQSELGVDQGKVNRAIKGNEDRNWESFLQSVEQRKKERGL